MIFVQVSSYYCACVGSWGGKMTFWYVKVPNDIFKIKHSCKLVATYLALFSYSAKNGSANPSLDSLSSDLKWSTYKISSILKILISLGFVNCVKTNFGLMYWPLKTEDNYTIISTYLIKHFCKNEGLDGYHIGLYIVFRKAQLIAQHLGYKFLWNEFCGFSEDKLNKKTKRLESLGLIKKTKDGNMKFYIPNNQYLVELSKIYKKNMMLKYSSSGDSSGESTPRISEDKAVGTPCRSDEYTAYFRPLYYNNNLYDKILRIHKTHNDEALPERVREEMGRLNVYLSLVARNIKLSSLEISHCLNSISIVASWFKTHEVILNDVDAKIFYDSLIHLQDAITT